ncbi:DUF1684 domain-containing protein [Myxococcus sp. Y35]|uniref:DUF1684 domain-containing protein n=1 Tax=Pseudomyxococcus flavus TaxID=3115648 RepID=UPI003CE8876D
MSTTLGTAQRLPSRGVAFFGPNRDEPYGARRELEAEASVEDKVVLDFDRTYSPTCTFSAYSLCPLPPRQNRLPSRVQAGEKRLSSH